MRKFLKKHQVVVLENRMGQQFQYKIREPLTGSQGSTCLCYIADRLLENEATVTVILKEFYPADISGDFYRLDDGFLRAENTENPIYRRLRKHFEKGICIMHECAGRDDMQDKVCADACVELLEGNGTIYYENLFMDGALSWAQLSKDPGVKMDDILMTAIEVIRFLKLLHESEKAYIDLKPEDILIPVSQMKIKEFSKPVFFDFNSILSMNRFYPLKEINVTREYRPSYFNPAPGENADTEKYIDLRTENATFASVLVRVTRQKMKTVTPEVRARISRLTRKLTEYGESTMTEQEVEKELTDIRTQIQKDESQEQQMRFWHETRKYRVIHMLAVSGVIFLYSVLTVALVFMCVCPSKVDRILVTNNISDFALWIILMLTAAFIFLLSKLNSWMAARVASTAVSLEYFMDKQKSQIRSGEYNTFRTGKTRAKTVFQDKSESNLKRQRRRRILWTALGILLISSLGLSILCKAFPVFLAAGFMVLLWFTYADFMPARNDFYYDYVTYRLSGEKSDWNIRQARARFYLDEYNKTERTFNRNHRFYTEHNRDLLKIRSRILENGFEKAPDKGMTFKERIRWLYDWDFRQKRTNQCEQKKQNLDFEPMQIRHIYKMGFDRLKNNGFICDLAVFVSILTAISLSTAICTGMFSRYFMLPEASYLGAVLLLSLAASGLGIFRAASAGVYEKLIAVISYKSRYILEESLNNELVTDIASGLIVPVDMARGLYQYEGAVTTGMKTMAMIRQARRLKYKPYNRQLFGYCEITNRSSLALTVWLIFGSLFSILVWYCGFYWMTLPLIGIAALSHVLLLKKLLPGMGRRKLQKDISLLIK